MLSASTGSQVQLTSPQLPRPTMLEIKQTVLLISHFVIFTSRRHVGQERSAPPTKLELKRTLTLIGSEGIQTLGLLPLNNKPKIILTSDHKEWMNEIWLVSDFEKDWNFEQLFCKVKGSVLGKKENCTLKIQTVAARAEPGNLDLKSHPKDYQQKLTYYYGLPSKYKPIPMLLNPIVPGIWP